MTQRITRTSAGVKDAPQWRLCTLQTPWMKGFARSARRQSARVTRSWLGRLNSPAAHGVPVSSVEILVLWIVFGFVWSAFVDSRREDS